MFSLFHVTSVINRHIGIHFYSHLRAAARTKSIVEYAFLFNLPVMPPSAAQTINESVQVWEESRQRFFEE